MTKDPASNGPDGSTSERDAEFKRTESLPDGSSSDAGSGDQDTASGGAPEDDIHTDADGTPVENPSG